MTPDEFEEGLDRWGADLTRWPADAAARARACLAGTAEARRQFAAAARLDDQLRTLAAHQAPAWLATRIAARTAAAGRLDRLLQWFGARLWRPALLAVAVTAAGYVTGLAVREPLSAVDSALAEDVMSLAFEDLYAELDDAE